MQAGVEAMNPRDPELQAMRLVVLFKLWPVLNDIHPTMLKKIDGQWMLLPIPQMEG